MKVGWVGLLVCCMLPVQGQPTRDEIQTCANLSRAQRLQTREAWDDTLMYIQKLASQPRPGTLTYFLQQQPLLDRQALEIDKLPCAAPLRPIQSQLATAYKHQRQALDWMVQLLSEGALMPSEVTELKTHLQQGTQLMQQAEQQLRLPTLKNPRLLELERTINTKNKQVNP